VSEIVERVAKAAYEKWIEGVETLEPPWEQMPQDFRDRMIGAQRAAIAAMREPTDNMIVAGDERILRHLSSHEMMSAIPTPSQNCFTAMIDEALR